MKTISKLLLLPFLFITINSYSQDTIKSISGNNIVSRVLEVNDTEIKYKTFDNLEGPLYVIKKKNVEKAIIVVNKAEITGGNTSIVPSIAALIGDFPFS